MKCDWGRFCTHKTAWIIGSNYSTAHILNAFQHLKNRQRVLTNIVWWQPIPCDISVEMYRYQKNKVDKKGGLKHNGCL